MVYRCCIMTPCKTKYVKTCCDNQRNKTYSCKTEDVYQLRKTQNHHSNIKEM